MSAGLLLAAEAGIDAATEALSATDVALLSAAGALLVLAVLLVAAEEALSRLTVVRAQNLADRDPRRAAWLEALLIEPEATRNPLRLIIVSAQLVHAVLVALEATRLLSAPAAVAVVAVDILVTFVLAEAVPRTLAILHTDRVALLAAGPVRLVLRLAPIRLLARALIGLSNWIVPGGGLRTGPFSIPEELIAFADAAVEDEVIEQAERDLIESVIEFSDTIVREVMVPRTDMTTVDRHLTVEETLEAASAVGFSRVPVVGGSIDDIVGLVYVKDLIRAELDGRGDTRVDELLRRTWFVPETKKVSDLLAEMQQEKFHMAVAVDEYGGIAGLVTLEDLIEELVGEIVDEYDEEESLLERQLDGTFKVDARILIDELNDLAGMSLPEGDWDTVGGLVFDLFGRVPKRGQECEVDGYRLRVDQVHGRRITKVTVSRPKPIPAVEEEAR
ncbi:MAG: hemolysin family protein [Actinomycetota bacterium]